MKGTTNSTMRAVVFDDHLRFDKAYPQPKRQSRWARICVHLAGVCNTDLEIIKGYMGFKGVPGHEFIGVVDQCDDPTWIGARVAGEINAACGRCRWCADGLMRHCPNRTVLGILQHHGCFADYVFLPVENLQRIPDDIPAERAVFIEPLSAACEILEQLDLQGDETAIVLGDGKLGILCAWVLSTVLADVTLKGHHAQKLASAQWRHIKTIRNADTMAGQADIVVEATGSAKGINEALSLCRPRGVIVLKSTVASVDEINLAPLVINEQTLIGSRCGQFKDGLQMMETYPDMPLERLITARFPIEQALLGFEQAALPDSLKILLEF
ncbi:alcohol dehydrogenase catalytic domain-containing protein [Desulfococcaceae bacterium HSG9]|nr:alcohol dehydrogenase catalytic domain-containing protein [Desulfococcaceae bacterium HSG9]